MTCIVEAVITSRLDEGVLEEFLEIIARLCGDLLLSGHVDQAVELLSMLSRTAARPGLPPDQVEKIDGVRARVITAEVLAGLTRLLAGEGIERGLLQRLVSELGRSAIEAICNILGEVPGKETRKVLIDALAEAGRETPGLFLPFLRDPRWFLVRNTIFILRRIAGPEVTREVSRCASHGDPRVRKEALLYFDENSDPAGESVLLSYLADDTPSLRVAAIRSLARRGSRTAADRLLALAASPAFAERERLERETVWEALGALAPGKVFPTLKAMLLKRRLFGQAKDLDDTACACAGLKRIGTPEAIEVLRQAADGKRGEARELVEKALRSIARGRAAGEAGGGRDGGEADRG
jgi:HEAT repeat protein